MIEHIDADLVTRYIESCSTFRAKATVYGTLSSMRGFGDYLVRQGLWGTNPLRWMKGPKVTPYSRLPKRIDREHMEAMWRAAAGRGGDYSTHLWVTVLAMLYGTGLRRGELERLDLDSFDRNEGTLRIDGRKTGRERCVPLPEMVLRCLEAYLPRRHNQLERNGLLGEQALLVTRSGVRLTATSTRAGLRAGVTARTLRHSFATHLMDRGVDLAIIASLMGHRSPQETGVYLHVLPQRPEAAVRTLPIREVS
jgi:site-specific recombinase XerD